ncbi:MAG: hypothetical protein CL917_13615 [Deltaproteobacteria bacterium]|nr:hypothetical protein [Deltaproteobacteria bacterium]
MRIRRYGQFFLVVMALGVWGFSSAQGSERKPGASGLVDSQLSLEAGSGSVGLPKPTPGGVVVGPREVNAVIKDRVLIQKTVRRRWDQATPEERNQMLEMQRKLTGDRSQAINDLERQELLDRMNSRSRVIQPRDRRVVDSSEGSRESRPRMSQGQRRALREHVRDLAPADRQILRERIDELHALNEVDQSILRDQLQHLMSLSVEEREQLDDYRTRWQSMTPDEQDTFRQRMLQLREMSSGQRQELLDRALGDLPNN